jgi:predicted small lipoprotein YifL/phosphoglycolate phosphatase-like HAD superfamily hydrolase
MKKILAMFLALMMVLSLAACGGEPTEEPSSEGTSEPVAEETGVHLARDDWADDVKTAVNDFVDLYGVNSEGYNAEAHPYVVFDFDNTCSIFDVEEQLAVYQLQVMAFAFTPEQLPEILKTGLGDLQEDRTDLGYGNGCYQDWIDDITAAYTYLYTTYGPFTAAGLTAEQQATVQADAQWQEFATKMRTLYDVVYDAESADVAYPWVLYWFTGMTEDEVYALATASHTTYKAVETSAVTWATPADIDAISKVGHVEYTWTSGTQVSENVVELWKTLDSNGIDVWVCSASATDPIRAAVDVWGLHDYVTGVLAMTNTLVDGKYVNSYDYETGYAWLNQDGAWVKGEVATGAQTQGIGKVTAIENVLVSSYGYGPIAGFMDSTGDFNFCTEFADLKLVVCFNRASRKITDGGGLAAEVAIYERDTLGYDLATANAAGDTLYVLQGREENGLRGLRNSNATMTLGATEEKLFKNEDNQAQLQYMIDNQMTVKDILDTFAIKTAADAEGNVLLLKYGFLKEYAGYHNIA